MTDLDSTKVCTMCKQEKPLSDFDRNRRHTDGRNSHCKACRKIYNRNVYQVAKDTPKQKRANRRNALRRYGITIDGYESLFKEQNGVCAICQNPPAEMSGRTNNLHVDHCHETNKVRGLLCIHCNRALGSLGDDLTGVMRAVRYLEKSELDLLPEISDLISCRSGANRVTPKRNRIVT